MKVKDFIFETFMRLTSKTVPYGYEDLFVSDVMKLLFPDDIKKDSHGNYFYKIGDSKTIFASHIDTVSKDYMNVVRKIEGDIISTDGKTTLGADDKAGMTIMLWMIENKIPGLYYFFIGEEVGCIGSGLASKYEDIKGNYDRVISFDRRGTDSIITFQSSGRCCSDKFADALCLELNKSNMSYKKDTGGVYTDSAEFVDIVSECTNISVGYYKEHTTSEHQDIKHLEKLAIACIKVDWENLPVSRDYSKTEYKSYGWGTTWNDDYIDSRSKTYSTYDDFHDIEDHHYGSRGKRNRRGSKKSSRTYFDNGGSLYDITNNINKVDEDFSKEEFGNDKYSWILNKFCNSNFTFFELETIKECYLDLDSDYDKWFYEYLKEQAIDY